jgi:hypothetical protein
VGTVALAIATFLAILTTIFITRQDRKRAAKQLADERSAADKRLAKEIEAANDRLKVQREYADAQFTDERAHSARQLEEERRIAREREQFAEAYKIQVLQGERDGGPPIEPIYEETDGSLKVYGAIIINGGAYTITDVDARLRLADGRVERFAGSERVTGTRKLPDQLSDGMVGLLEALSHSDRLAPWDVGLRFYTDPMPLMVWYPVVRWKDRWGTHWEHRKGEMRQIEEGEDWTP